jgi:hypothetical protein
MKNIMWFSYEIYQPPPSYYVFHMILGVGGIHMKNILCFAKHNMLYNMIVGVGMGMEVGVRC